MINSKRKISLVVLLALIPIGISTKFYYGPERDWVHDYAGDIIYTMFFFFLFHLIWNRTNTIILAGAAFGFSTVVEFTQLIDTNFLKVIRSTFLGRTLVGTGFTTTDILYYLLGSVLGWIMLFAIDTLHKKHYYLVE